LTTSFQDNPVLLSAPFEENNAKNMKDYILSVSAKNFGKNNLRNPVEKPEPNTFA
jgi:hypothetical protein